MTVVGILHPGEMGVSVGAAARSAGADVVWVASGRSARTARRAETGGLLAVGGLDELVDRSDVVVSVCPPSAAEDTAESVAEAGFDGIYVDANATAPETVRRIAGRFRRFVDGGIIGPPAQSAGTTRLYLSGEVAADVAGLWRGSPLEAIAIAGGPGAASALKMAYATWTKVAGALLIDVRALARAEGVEDALLAEWARSQPEAAARSEATARGSGPKAWRFVGEMEQIAASFDAVGLPAGFALGAAELYARMATFKDRDDVTLDDVVEAVLGRPGGAG